MIAAAHGAIALDGTKDRKEYKHKILALLSKVGLDPKDVIAAVTDHGAPLRAALKDLDLA